MDLWINLLFGNPVGLLSMATVLGAIVFLGVLSVMLLHKSGRRHP